jgi:electron transfer flavoprotein alpha subunit
VRIAVLVKQVPQIESLQVGRDQRLIRDGVSLEMNAYCRRAVSQGVEIARASGGSCHVYTLGPDSAEDVLREAIAWGADGAVLISDPAFAGSDTLATARALAAALVLGGPWDLVLVGRNSVDANTGQIGPEVAELLDLPFAGAVRELAVAGGKAAVRCELDDGWREATVSLPAVISAAERLITPCKSPVEARQAVESAALRRLTATDLGSGPWGQEGSPTTVGRVRTLDVSRHRIKLSGPVEQQVASAVALMSSLSTSIGFQSSGPAVPGMRRQPVPAPIEGSAHIVVVAEPGQSSTTSDLLSWASLLAADVSAKIIVAGPQAAQIPPGTLAGADQILDIEGTMVEEDHARALAQWANDVRPWAMLFSSTMWGREVAGRLAASLDLGLTGDAVELTAESGKLVCWKPAFGGRLVAAITSDSDIQLVTLRPGMSPGLPVTRVGHASAPVTVLSGDSRLRVTVSNETHDWAPEDLLRASNVVSVGQGVKPNEYIDLDPLLSVLCAELAATRKVTDLGWLPRSKQIGITGHSIAPALNVVIAASGKFNHMVGSQASGLILAINSDPAAPVFDWADIGIVADWREAVPLLAQLLSDSGAAETDLPRSA